MLGILIALCSGCTARAGDPAAQPSRVTVQQLGDSWSLLRNGEPYFVKGAGGSGHLDRLVAAGGNSIRTWGADNAQEVLDRAHAHGISVTLGIWIQHPRHGFDYNDKEAVQRQREMVREIVRAHKDHPALLMWGVGNEVELQSDPETVMPEINTLAKIIEEIDPNHPTMAVLAGVGDNKVRSFVRHCKDVDLLGINAYSEAKNVPELITEQGYTGPFLITEFGPTGHWEIQTAAWGAPIEPTSTEKAESYELAYRVGVLGHPDRCLGSYVFLWGQKQEVTSTWYGMFLPTGESTQTLDAMHRLWSGDEPEQHAPGISRIQSPVALELADPDSLTWARVEASDADGDKLSYKWAITAESTDRHVGGDRESVPPSHPELILEHGPEARLRTPARQGAYRLSVTVTDGTGRAATANIPFLVR